MPNVAPVASDHSPGWHLARFCEFASAKESVGEPSPHMTVVGWLAKDLPDLDRVWWACCYLNPYSVLSAEILAAEWPYERFAGDANPEFDPWLEGRWKQIHTRTERRCVRTPQKFARAMRGFARWMAGEYSRLPRQGDPRQLYDAWWKSVEGIPFFGRYINIRLLEYGRRYCGWPTELYDIRSIGGWSPIRALTMFRPEETGSLLAGDAAVADRVAYEVYHEVVARQPMTYYVFAAMLCEYREAYEDRHQYPGRTLDQELDYHNRHLHRDPPGNLMAARRALFRPEVLGEASGWEGIRHDLSAVLRDHGYVWSDLRYRYTDTRNLSQPQEQPAA